MFTIDNGLNDKGQKITTKVWFKYGMEGNSRTTTCTFSVYLDKTKVNDMVSQTAYCLPKDTFTRSKGRKYSLRYALRSLALPKEDRVMFWNAYKEACSSKEKKEMNYPPKSK